MRVKKAPRAAEFNRSEFDAFKNQPDYRGYEADKQRLLALPLSPEEYEAAVKAAAERRGI